MGNGRVVRNSVVYTCNSLLLRAFNFFLLPLYTNYLSTGDYGTINLVGSFSTVASYIVAFSLYSAIIRFYVDIKEDRKKVKRFFGTIILFIFLSGLFFVLIVVVFNQFFIALIFKGLKFYPTVLISMLGLTFSCLHSVYQYILKGMEKAKKFSIISIGFFLIQLALNIMFVVYLHWGANGVLLASLITNLLFFIYMMIDLSVCDLITICIDKTLLKGALVYSVPLLPHDLSTHITSLVSRIFINNSFSLSSVGLFSLASQFGSITDMVQASVNMAFQPWFYDQMNKREEGYKKKIVQLSDVFAGGYGIIFLIIALFSQEAIIIFTNKNYIKAWTVVPMIVAAYSIKIIYYFYINILLYYKKATRFIFTATLSSSLINMLLSAIFIPKMDMYGSVLADEIAMIIRVTIIVALSRQFEEIGYKISKFIRLIAVNILFIGIGSIFSYTKYMYEFNWINLLYKFIVLFVYIIIEAISLRSYIKPIIAKVLERYKESKNKSLLYKIAGVRKIYLNK